MHRIGEGVGSVRDYEVCGDQLREGGRERKRGREESILIIK